MTISSLGGIGGSSQRAKTMDEMAKEYLGENGGRIADNDIRDRVLKHRMNDRVYGLTMRRSGEESSSGQAPTFLSSMFKLYGTEQNKDRFDLMLSIMGSQMLGWEGDAYTGRELGTTREWLRSKANSI